MIGDKALRDFAAASAPRRLIPAADIHEQRPEVIVSRWVRGVAADQLAIQMLRLRPSAEIMDGRLGGRSVGIAGVKTPRLAYGLVAKLHKSFEALRRFTSDCIAVGQRQRAPGASIVGRDAGRPPEEGDDLTIIVGKARRTECPGAIVQQLCLLGH